MTHTPRLPLLAGLPLAVAAGLLMPVQGRINGALGVALADGIAAAVVSFTTGLALMIVISLALPKGRAGLARILPAVREREFPPYYVLAGCIGGFFVFAQSFTVGLLGVALFTVATVTGQTLSGLLVDRMGIGPAGKRSITGIRVIGSILTVAAVAWAVSPRFSGAGFRARGAAGSGAPSRAGRVPDELPAGHERHRRRALRHAHRRDPDELRRRRGHAVGRLAGQDRRRRDRATRCRGSGGTTSAGPWAASSSASVPCWSAAWACW